MLHMLRFSLLLSLVELWRLQWPGEVLVENACNWGRSKDKRSVQSSQQIFSSGAAVHSCSSSWSIRQGFNSIHLTAWNSRRCNLWYSYEHKRLQLEQLSEQLLLVMKVSRFSSEIHRSPVMLKYPSSSFSKKLILDQITETELGQRTNSDVWKLILLYSRAKCIFFLYEL